jgi:hypothetical protein
LPQTHLKYQEILRASKARVLEKEGERKKFLKKEKRKKGKPGL